MTPLHLRRRLRAVVTMIAGPPLDEPNYSAHAAERAKAWEETARFHAQNEDYYRGLLDKCAPHLGPGVYVQDDGGIVTDPLRAKVPELVRALREARDVEEQCRCDADDLRATAERERDEAVALNSTLRGELDDYAQKNRELTGTLLDVKRDRDALVAKVARLTGEKAPKRKRTKEERDDALRDRLGALWSSPFATALRADMRRLGPATSRQIAMTGWGDNPPSEGDITNAMRLVSDLARAGYLTVAKGPGGVRVYGLKEGV